MSRHRFRLLRLNVAGTLVLVAVSGCQEPQAPNSAAGSENSPPTAAFSARCSDLTCVLTDESTDDDGTVEARVWDFGDGRSGTGRNPSHTYDAPGGQFTVTLTVTDDAGDATTTTRQVTVQPMLVQAAFVSVCAGLTCNFVDRSNGPVVSRAWDFGDGETSDEQNPQHTYARPGGRFNVTLRVIAGWGGESTTAADVEVSSVGDVSGTYERETSHDPPDRHSRMVIRSNRTFELLDWVGTDTATYSGRWLPIVGWFGMALEPGTAIYLNFDVILGDGICGEAFGVFMTDTRLAIALCGPAINAGLQEGVYSSAPGTGTTLPPPQAGQIAFVRDGLVYLVNTDGGGLVQLTAGPGDGAPVWSPGGDRIAFARSGGAAPGIYVSDADGSNAARLTDEGGASGDPDWSPDGEWIVFVCGNELCKIEADGSGTSPVRFTPWLTGHVSSPSWSPDDTRIAFSSDWANLDFWFDIWAIAADGTQMTALTTHTPAAPNPFEFREPTWSPDGQRIAYVACPWAWNVCSSSAISVMNADGSAKTVVVTAGGPGRPTWSPDGQLIAYSSGSRIEWVSADGSQRGLIVDSGHSPSWRP